MTRNELKTKLQEVCENHVTILDVFFYKHKKKQMVVVVEVREYGALSDTLGCRNYNTVEKAVLAYYDTERLGTTKMDMDDRNIQSASAMIEEL